MLEQSEVQKLPQEQDQPTFCLSVDGRELHMSFADFARVLWPMVVDGWYQNKMKVEPALLASVRPFAAKTLRKDGVAFERGDDALDIMLREYFSQMIHTLTTWRLDVETDGNGNITNANLTAPKRAG